MTAEKRTYWDKLIEEDIDKARATHKDMRDSFRALAAEKKNEERDQEDFYDKIRDLIVKYEAAGSFSLAKTAADEDQHIIWLLELHGSDHLKGGQRQIIKSFKGYIQDIYDALEEYLQTEYETDPEEVNGQRGKKNGQKL